MLTDTEIRKAKPGERPRKLGDGRGLYLLFASRGRPDWGWGIHDCGSEAGPPLGLAWRALLLNALADRRLLT